MEQGAGRIGGAYRAGNTSKIVVEQGVAGLYTNTLFRYDERLLERRAWCWNSGDRLYGPNTNDNMRHCFFCGRLSRASEALRPETPALFGAVSVSNTYNRASRELIYSFFEARKQGDDLADLVTLSHGCIVRCAWVAGTVAPYATSSAT